MFLVSNVLLVCFIVLTQVNQNAVDAVSRTNKNKPNKKENREVLKKLVDFLNDSDRTNTNDEPEALSVLDGVDIRNPGEMETVMKHLQKNYDYDIMAELTHNKPRVHVIRNPDVLDDFVDTLQKEESVYTSTPDILKSTVRRYGDFGFGKAKSSENYGKWNRDLKSNKYPYQSNFNNKKNTQRNDYNKKSYFGNEEKRFNRPKYGSRETFSKRGKYDSRDRFDSREKYNKNNYNKNKGSYFNRNKDNVVGNKYDTRNRFNRHEKDKFSFRTIKIPGSRIRSRDEDEKGLDIPENNFKKPPIITWNLGMSSESNNANKKNNDEPVSDSYYVSKVTSKDLLDDFERRKRMENAENDWSNHNKHMDWSEVGIEKSTQRNNNDWSQVGIDKGTKKEWSNVAIYPSAKDWSEVGIEKKSSSKRYYNDEDFTLKKEVDDFTTQFAPAFTDKWKNDVPSNDWDQPMKNYENKYKNKMEKLYTHENKRHKANVRSDFGYSSFGKTPIPFVGKRNVYADN